LIPARRRLSRMLAASLWHIEENFEMKKS